MSIWQKIFSCSGRIGRMDFFLLHLAALVAPSILAGFMISSQMVTLGTLADPTDLQITGMIFTSLLILLVLLLLVSWIMFALSAKRLHDVSYSSWWQLIYVTPAAPVLFVALLFVPGSPMANKYGLAPAQEAVTVIPPQA